MEYQISADSQYLELIGRVTYCFNFLEWQILYVGENIEPGFIRLLQGATAERIALAFSKLVNQFSTDKSLQDILAQLADEFADLVERRNSLVHAFPMTDTNGKHRLHCPGKLTWQDPDLNQLVLDIERCAVKGNTLYCNFNDPYGSWYQSRKVNPDNADRNKRADDLLNGLGKAIRIRRKILNLSQDNLADRTSLHRTYLSEIERGKRNCSIGVLTSLANGLQLKVLELVELAEEQMES